MDLRELSARCEELYQAFQRAQNAHFEAISAYDRYRQELGLGLDPTVVVMVTHEQAQELERLSTVASDTMSEWMRTMRAWRDCSGGLRIPPE